MYWLQRWVRHEGSKHYRCTTDTQNPEFVMKVTCLPLMRYVMQHRIIVILYSVYVQVGFMILHFAFKVKCSHILHFALCCILVSTRVQTFTNWCFVRLKW